MAKVRGSECENTRVCVPGPSLQASSTACHLGEEQGWVWAEVLRRRGCRSHPGAAMLELLESPIQAFSLLSLLFNSSSTARWEVDIGPWASYLTSLCLNFLLWSMEIMKVPLLGNSPVVQGLGLGAFIAQVQSLVEELRSHNPRGVVKQTHSTGFRLSEKIHIKYLA